MREQYFHWLVRRVSASSHTKLCRLLDRVEFTYILDMDSNRAEDGINLRYRFGYEKGYSFAEVEDALGCGRCSVFEMMVALANRCEEQIMGDPDLGDRTSQWFFEMLESLGIDGMDDRHFDPERAQIAVDHFLRREYAPDGRGGLFTIPGTHRDMRKAEIWYQMMWHLDSIIYGRE